jgi:predicted permease
MARSFLRLLEQHPGFRTEGVLAMSLASPPQADVAGLKRLAQFHEALLSRLQGLPGVEQAGGINAFPLSGSMANGMFLILTGMEDQHLSFEDWTAWAKNHPDRVGQAEFRVASAGYFPAMGIPLVRGRLFEQTDGPDAPHVAVISESLAQQAFAGRDPIGQSIQFGNMDGDLRLFTIVGIVGDVRDYGLDSQPQPTFYAFYRQRPSNTVNFTVVLRGKGDLAPLMAAARSVLREMAPDVPARFQTAEEILVHSVAERRFALLLLSVFGSTALLLAAVGIYSLTAYAVQRRTQEIGIRMALGAQRGDVLRMILTQSSRLVVIGTALGLAGAIALTRYLRSLLFEVSPTDPATLAVITLLLGAVAILGSLGPAWRATQVDPLAALRYE